MKICVISTLSTSVPRRVLGTLQRERERERERESERGVYSEHSNTPCQTAASVGTFKLHPTYLRPVGISNGNDKTFLFMGNYLK